MYSKDRYGRLLVPMVTPFKENGDVDYEGMVEIGEMLIEKKWADTFILTGSTGEFFTMSGAERIKVFEIMYTKFGSRIPIIAGVGCASTRETVELALAAQNIGYELVMVVAPYYTKPSQLELLTHYQKVSSALKIDMLIYNIPIFTGVNVSPTILSQLAKIKNIVGIKEEAELNPKQMTEFLNATSDDFVIYNGDDTMVSEAYIQGYERIGGIVSGCCQIIGDKFKTLIDYIQAGKVQEASKLQRSILPLLRSMGQNGRTNGVGLLKDVMRIMGYPAGYPRAPLLPGTPEEVARLRAEMVKIGAL